VKRAGIHFLFHFSCLMSAITACLVTPSFGSERYEFFTGVRQNGMGGVYVTTVNDETALLSNPAALGRLRGYIATIADPEISGGQENMQILGANGALTLLEPQGLLDALNQQKDKHWHAKAQLFPSAVFSNFGFGVFAKQVYDAEVISTTSRYLLDYTYDVALVLGYSLRLFDGRVKIGFAGRYLNRSEIIEDLDSDSTSLQRGDLIKEGAGIAGDGGILLTGPWTFLPTIGATIRDIGTTSFNINDGVFYKNGRKPQSVPQTVDVGIGLFPIHSNYIRSSISIEYQDVLTAGNETDIWRRFHGGWEVNLGDMIFLRAGVNQRYWTAGLEFSMRFMQIQFATYGEEIGTATSFREDRRYTGKFAIRF